MKSSHHTQLTQRFREAARQAENCITQKMGHASYTGSQRECLFLKNPVKHAILNEWIKENKKGLSYDEFVALLDALAHGQTVEERTSVGYLLQKFPKFRRQLNLQKLDEWLGDYEGWSEIDSLCQSAFDETDLLPRWAEWEALLKLFNSSDSISKRRASLVLLIKTLRKSDDSRAVQLAFQNILNLAHEKDILITKAISWLLREMTKLHAKQVVAFIDQHTEALPSIAVRETRRKLATGRK